MSKNIPDILISFFDAIRTLEKAPLEKSTENVATTTKATKVTKGSTKKQKDKEEVKGIENTPENFAAFKDFIETLNTEMEEYRESKIESFWRKTQTPSTITGAVLSWIDNIKLTQAKANIMKNKDTSHTRCFDNLIVDKKPLIVQDFSIFNELDKELPNFKEVTKYYRGAFALNQSRSLEKYQAPRPVLLLGNPGIGKTHFAKKLATLLGTSYKFFDAHSITGNWVLSGNNATWRGADAGLIFKEMARSESMSPIILLDEIDKINANSQYSPFSTFHQMFEKQNAQAFFDEFANVTFDASQIIYILTANDASNIAPSLLSRMNVFHIDNPSTEDMPGIIQNIYSEVLDGSNLFYKTLHQDEVGKMLKLSPREVTQIISKNVFEQASVANVENRKTKQRLKISSELFKNKQKLGF